jgi:hypothetical protein
MIKLILIIIAILLLEVGSKIADKTGCGCFEVLIAIVAFLAYCFLV